MSKRALAVVAVAGSLWLSACGGSVPDTTPGEILPSLTPAPAGATQSPQPEATPTEEQGRGLDEGEPTSVSVSHAAQEFLAAQTGIDLGAMEVVSIEEVEWPNGALGCPQPGQMYMEVITPGYRVVIEAEGETYQIHTNHDGSSVVICDSEEQSMEPNDESASAGNADQPSPTPPASETGSAATGSDSSGSAGAVPVVPLPSATPGSGTSAAPPSLSGQAATAGKAALDLVASSTGLARGELQIVESTSTVWPDSGIGCPQPGMMYMTVLTPGYKFVVQGAGQRYFVHSNRDGSNVILCDRDVTPPPSNDQ